MVEESYFSHLFNLYLIVIYDHVHDFIYYLMHGYGILVLKIFDRYVLYEFKSLFVTNLSIIRKFILQYK